MQTWLLFLDTFLFRFWSQFSHSGTASGASQHAQTSFKPVLNRLNRLQWVLTKVSSHLVQYSLSYFIFFDSLCELTFLFWIPCFFSSSSSSAASGSHSSACQDAKTSSKPVPNQLNWLQGELSSHLVQYSLSYFISFDYSLCKLTFLFWIPSFFMLLLLTLMIPSTYDMPDKFPYTVSSLLLCLRQVCVTSLHTWVGTGYCDKLCWAGKADEEEEGMVESGDEDWNNSAEETEWLNVLVCNNFVCSCRISKIITQVL